MESGKLVSNKLTTRYLILFIPLLLGIILVPTALVQSAPEAITFIEPGASGVRLAEIDEFATMVLGDPWDMNEATDLSYYRRDSQLNNSTFSDGVYSAQMTGGVGAERITLLSAGAPNNTAMRIGKIGYNYPIDANKYRYLTLRLYKSNAQYNSALVQWYETDAYTNEVVGYSNSFPVPSGAGWHTIVVDLATIGNQSGGKTWAGTIRELIIHPFAGPGAAGANVQLDWARLTAADPNKARPYTIRWSGGSGQVNLYASPGDKNLDGQDILIASGIDAQSGAHTFQTGILPAGSYYIAAVDGSGASWSNGPLTINALPQIKVETPSMTSGEKYGADFMGDGWSHAQVTDLNQSLLPWQTSCVSGERFSDGIYSANLVPNCGGVYVDPILSLGGMDRYPRGIMDPTIDTHRYRYLSFRMYHSGIQDVHEGWVARFGWWQTGPDDGASTQEVVMSRDIVLLEGWNTYIVDLWAPDVVDEAHPIQRSWRDSAPNRLRLDPSELNSTLTPASIQLDWIQLTAIDDVTAGDSYPIWFDAEDGTELSLYYDTDNNPGNGRGAIGQTIAGPDSASMQVSFTPESDSGIPIQDAANHAIFLPSISSNSAACNLGECITWDTGNIDPGIYYICAESDDGLNSVYRCSEAPVIIR
jgi:hypothetical protein